MQLLGVKCWLLHLPWLGPQSSCGSVAGITATEKPNGSGKRKGENLIDCQQKHEGYALQSGGPRAPKTHWPVTSWRTFALFASLSHVAVLLWTVDTCAAATAATRALFNANVQYVEMTSQGFCLCTTSEPGKKTSRTFIVSK